MKKISSHTIVKSYDLTGGIGFLFNCCQSIISEVVFGLLNLYIFDVLIVDSSKLNILLVALLMTALYFILAIPLWGYWMEKCVNRTKANLENFLVKKYFSLHPRKVVEKHSSYFLSMLQEDVGKTAELGGWQLVVLVQAVISGIVSVIVFGSLSIEILGVLLIIGIIPMLINSFCVPIIRHTSQEIRVKTEQRLKTVIDFINNIIIMKVYRIENTQIKKVLQSSAQICSLQKKIYNIELLTNTMQDFIFNGVYRIVIVLMGLYYYDCGKLSVGSIMFMLSMSEGLSFCIGSLGSYIKEIQEVLVSKKRIDDFGNLENEWIEDGDKITHIEKIEFQNIYFSYPDGNKVIFENMSLGLDREDNYVLLGENGSGKSSVIKLLFGLYQPLQGNICINDGYFVKNLQDRIAYVPQEPDIYEGTLLYNLLLEKSDYDEKEVILALETVELLSWANSLERKLQTVFQEKGKDISRGQKTRIALARALIRRPDFIFADEIDANIDAEMLKYILNNIRQNYMECSIVAVTHRENEDIYKDFRRIQIKNNKCYL